MTEELGRNYAIAYTKYPQVKLARLLRFPLEIFIYFDFARLAQGHCPNMVVSLRTASQKLTGYWMYIIRKLVMSLTLISVGWVHLICQQQEPSHIRFDRGCFSFNFSDLNKIKWQTDRHYQVYVGQQADVGRLKNILIETSQIKGEELISAEVNILRPNGLRDTTYKADAFIPQPFDAEITDHLLILDELAVGDTINVKYIIQSKPSTQIHRWTVQYDYPVKESIITVLVPQVFTFNTTMTDEKYFVEQKTIDSTLRLDRGKIELVGFENTFKNIPAFRDEPFAPPAAQSKPACLFSLSDFSLGEDYAYLPTWSEQFVDLAVSELFGKQYRLKSNYRWLIEEAGALLKNKYADRLLIFLLYQKVHELFTWDGSYGLIPSDGLQEMQFERTVNKSALNMALLALLTEAEYKAYPVLVTTTEQPKVAQNMEDINQFNHFVIEVQLSNREVLYLDAGEPTLPVGWVSSGIWKEPVVRIQNYRGNLSSLPEFGANSTINVQLQVQEDLSAIGIIEASFQGYDAHNERLLLQNDRQALYWKDRAASLSPDLRIDSVRFENVSNLMQPFENKIYFHIPAATDGDELSINPVFYSFFSGNYFADTARQNDVMLPFVIQEQCQVRIETATGMQVTLPESKRFRIDTGEATCDFQASEPAAGSLQCLFKANINQSNFSSNEYPKLKQFLDMAYEQTNQNIVIKPKI